VFEGAQKLQLLLVVDDEEIIHVLVGEMLKGQQLEVIGVTSGEEALKSYHDANGAVKAVILDMSLPCMDGLRIPEAPGVGLSGESNSLSWRSAPAGGSRRQGRRGLGQAGLILQSRSPTRGG
tara:strand:+ start:631 stop:996 length:366 start_codon:yes stop_codon:yes gene_type:complete